MRVSEMFPSKYLKADDLQGGSYNVTIARVEFDEFTNNGKTEQRPVVYFKETDKGLVLNKTNAYNIAHLHGEETDGWPGKVIELYPDTVMMGHQPTPCIRLRMASRQTAPQPSYADRRDPPINDPAMQGPAPDLDDSIPF